MSAVAESWRLTGQSEQQRYENFSFISHNQEEEKMIRISCKLIIYFQLIAHLWTSTAITHFICCSLPANRELVFNKWLDILLLVGSANYDQSSGFLTISDYLRCCLFFFSVYLLRFVNSKIINFSWRGDLRMKNHTKSGFKNLMTMSFYYN